MYRGIQFAIIIIIPLTVDNPTWDDNLAALCEYRDRHGTVNIPDRSSHYPQLGRFVYNLRRQKSLLTQIQKQQLDELGFLWESSLDAKRQQQWEDMFDRLVAFQQEHGHCVVPQQYEKDPPLGIWVMNQRSRWKLSELETSSSSQAALTEDQRERLAAIGFVVRLRPGGARKQTKFEQRWNLRFQELLAYQEEHGDCNVPLTFVKNKKLANWVHTQRQYHKKGQLRWDRYQALCDIGFTWDFAEIHDESWHRRYKQVKTYYEQLQQYKLQQSDTSKLPTLSDRAKVWKDNQRRAHASGYLDPDRKALLDEIEGFEWRQE
ncbi:helicase [Seminavis robusta]|uniref:Helicase n=1 Tax=Seminavis robusta TaxID=568900 RepID=A0A9N8E8K0_9STRA|nr:helicase [Seminavis robusta]|eukprot:Sro612_g175490.1 helicase (319) ;mRNA; f:42836-43932